MGFLDALFGRRKQIQPNLDDWFALPSAALELEAATGFTPAGREPSASPASRAGSSRG